MPPDSIPQLSLGTAVLVIFAVCAGFVLLRGMTRMLVGTLILAASAWAAFFVWQEAPLRILEWTGRSPAWLTNSLPIVAFAVCWLLLRKLAKAVVSPFSSSGNDKPRTLAGAAVRLVFALIPTLLISLISAVVIHHTGSVAEVRSSGERGTPSLGERLKVAVDSAIPRAWLEKLDPNSSSSRISLAKLIAAEAKAPRAVVIDPQTGKPIPRAKIVEDPQLQALAREGKFGTLLRHPLLTKALADPKIQKLLRDLHL
ncbi:MAG: hypothetical protein V4819_18965 [Verrucomicrobiota bacterium]